MFLHTSTSFLELLYEKVLGYDSEAVTMYLNWTIATYFG
jgi:hypothetical protein